MKTVITGRKFDVSERMKSIIERKITRLDKFFPKEAVANVTMSTRRDQARIEITILYNSTIFRAETEDRDAVTALYDAVDILERQIRKNRTKLAKKLRDTDFKPFVQDEPEDDFEEDVIKISKVKEFVMTAMTPEEAVLQMNLLGHTFYMFQNTQNGKICVVYSREDGEYGLLIPDEE